MKWGGKTDVTSMDIKWGGKNEVTVQDKKWGGDGDVISQDIKCDGSGDIIELDMNLGGKGGVIARDMKLNGTGDVIARDIKRDNKCDVTSRDMTWTGKCDVEISITMAGEETVEAIPECLHGAFMSTPGDRVPDPRDHVVLPERYTQSGNCTDCEKARVGGGLADRERDLDTALRWIKQEVTLMQEQDKALMKQFINLRSGILQLRCLYDLDSSTSDLSHDGSSLSLDERSPSPCTLTDRYLANPDLEMTEFRARTTSLSKGQNIKPVTRIKWKSHEYI